MRHQFVHVPLLILLGLSFTIHAVAATYTFTSIDVPGSARTEVNGINDAGRMVGTFQDSTGHMAF